ncbi:hypothetical protein H5410_044024 [Solanum commersonii]|uniref:Uncharacterized protein n=1 Tax=Solanum commersonii TaxID=4109 RepID=A0A9J5Y313_SOLCO|nr:hypothetical protein H5410_044024 [Solanum commersonii]
MVAGLSHQMCGELRVARFQFQIQILAETNIVGELVEDTGTWLFLVAQRMRNVRNVTCFIFAQEPGPISVPI